VPALRASAPKDCYLPGPSTPAEGVPALRAYGLQDAIYRGLRPRQRVCQPFGPMGPEDATYRGLRPRQRVCQPFGPMRHKIATYRGLRPRQRGCRPFGPMQPQDCYLPGPLTPAEGVPGPRAYGPQDATYRGLRPRLSLGGPIRSLDHCASKRRFVGIESKSDAIRPIQSLCKLYGDGCV
jgi:hypothetical protein